METSREYYNRVMADCKANRGRRSLRKYCHDEGIDYHWLVKSMKEFAAPETRDAHSSDERFRTDKDTDMNMEDNKAIIEMMEKVRKENEEMEAEIRHSIETLARQQARIEELEREIEFYRKIRELLLKKTA